MIFPFTLYRFLNNPRDYLENLQKKHGDPFPLSFPGAKTIWLTGKSEYAKAVFTSPPDSFTPSEKNPVAPLLGKDGLIMIGGQNHLSTRKDFMSHFSKGNLQSFAPVIKEVFTEIAAEKDEEGLLTLQSFSFKATLKIILRYLFPHLEVHEYREAEKLTESFLKSYSASFLFIPQWVPMTWNVFHQNKVALDEKFYEYYRSGVRAKAKGPLYEMAGLNDDGPGMEKNKILDHIRTFIVAGHETSATSLTWSLFYILKDPYLKNRCIEQLALYEENSDFKKILEDPFFDSLVSEGLRINPPVPFITRKIQNRSLNWAGREFEIDDEIGVCLSLLHRQENIWKNPEEFKPERFVENKFSPFEFAPFGGGTRRCLGAELSLIEIKVLIAEFLRTFDCELVELKMPISEVLQITIGPKKPIMVEFKKRK
jgi:cytochrome P450